MSLQKLKKTSLVYSITFQSHFNQNVDNHVAAG